MVRYLDEALNEKGGLMKKYTTSASNEKLCVNVTGLCAPKMHLQLTFGYSVIEKYNHLRSDYTREPGKPFPGDYFYAEEESLRISLVIEGWIFNNSNNELVLSVLWEMREPVLETFCNMSQFVRNVVFSLLLIRVEVLACVVTTDSAHWNFNLPTFSKTDNVLLFAKKPEEILTLDVEENEVHLAFRFPAFSKSLSYQPALSLHLTGMKNGSLSGSSISHKS